MIGTGRYWLVGALLFAWPAIAWGQADTVRSELTALGALPPPGIVAAKVSGKAIDSADVNRLITQTLRGRPASKAALPGLQAQALEQVINRELVVKYLDEKEITVSDKDVEKAIEERSKSAGGNLADVLARLGLTLDGYRDEVRFELRWGKLVRTMITEELLEKFFQAHHQEFDGTELRVSHILLRPDGPLTPEEVDNLQKRAETIRDEIVGELTTFADAAKRYSLGPSRHKGGDIGFIARHGVMPEEFSGAAFALEKGEVSKPVVTHLGVHLIQATDVRPGKKTWRDVRKDLQPSATQNMFNELAAHMRERSSIEYTGDLPYLDPKTRKLVDPNKADEVPIAEADAETK